MTAASRGDCISSSAWARLEAGKVPLDWVTGQLGHSSVVLTKHTYGHWSREAERKQAQALEGAFSI